MSSMKLAVNSNSFPEDSHIDLFLSRLSLCPLQLVDLYPIVQPEFHDSEHVSKKLEIRNILNGILLHRIRVRTAHIHFHHSQIRKRLVLNAF